jgi:hypothetical protein
MNNKTLTKVQHTRISDLDRKEQELKDRNLID